METEKAGIIQKSLEGIGRSLDRIEILSEAQKDNLPIDYVFRTSAKGFLILGGLLSIVQHISEKKKK